MNILELSAAMARTFVTQEQADDAMLLACCKAAEAELLSFLKSGLTEEDCADSFTLACCYLALSYLCAGRSTAPEQFSVGDISIRRGGEDISAACLRTQAKLIMAPFVTDSAFAFKGVRT